MRKLILTLVFVITLIGLVGVFSAPPVQADVYDDITDQFDDVQEGVTGTSTAKTPTHLVIDIIQVALGFLGLVFVILILFSGFQWMTAGGNEDTITQARKRLVNAVIGLVIILAAYGIAEFVINQVDQATRR